MVRISRESLNSKRSRLKRGLFSLGRFLSFVGLASLIPSLFFLRWYLQSSPSRSWRDVLQGQHPDYAFDVLQTLRGNNVPHNVLLESISDVAELYYCDVEAIATPHTAARANFTAWARPLLNESLTALLRRPEVAAQVHVDLIQQEFVLELLELYANVRGLCDWAKYQIKPVLDRPAAAKLQGAVPPPDGAPRLAYVVVVHDDVAHLRRLLPVLHRPWHSFVLHLDRFAAPEVAREVRALADRYPNVAVVQFGTIVYKTDSVSMVNLRLMQWLHREVRLSYDYLVTTGASVFPLVRDVGAALRGAPNEDRSVWLGEALLHGEPVYEDQSYLLRQARLIYTRGPLKLHRRLPRAPFAALKVPEDIRLGMTYKTQSGNQGIYASSVVQDLLASRDVARLFGMAKYACCCCLEERTWVAALETVGYGHEARERPAVFQVWGGVDDTCKISMKNALLGRNASLCYRTEDATMDPDRSLEFRGNETLDYLRDAQARGVLFARKFRSDFPESLELMRIVQEEIW